MWRGRGGREQGSGEGAEEAGDMIPSVLLQDNKFAVTVSVHYICFE